MASIVKKKGSSKLYLRYSLHGKRIEKSTGKDDTPANRRFLKNEVIPKLEAKIALGLIDKKSELFKVYAAEWMESKKDNKSFYQKKFVYDLVIEYFGDKRVSDITRLDVKRYLTTLDIKENSKRGYLSTIKGVLDLALDDEAIDKNVAVGIPLKSSKPQPKPFSEDEVRMILDRADGMLRNYLGIAFYTGLRSGEVLGLMRSDIGESSISIKRSISKGKVTTPKTDGSIRTVPMFEAVRPFIEDQLKRSKSLYLFEHEGHYISDIGVIRKRKWRRLLLECGLEYRKIYSTRHTFITAMLNGSKYKLTTIAKIVGHTNIKMIVEKYAGFIKDDHLKVDFEDDIFSKTPEKEPKIIRLGGK